jgi:thiol-disulfide isomerase/thioredoxin
MPPSPALSSEGTAAVLPCPALPSAAPVPGGLPALRLPCLGAGPAVDLAALRGVPTVVNVWAAWCVNCSREMPLLDAAAKQAGDRVRFLGVHAFADAPEGRDAAMRFPVRFPSLQDSGPRDVRSTLGVAGPPYTFFVRADGTLAYTKIGEIRNAAELARLLQTHLGVAL